MCQKRGLSKRNGIILWYEKSALVDDPTTVVNPFFILFPFSTGLLLYFCVSSSRCRFFDDSRCNMHVYHVVFFTLFIYLITINDVFCHAWLVTHPWDRVLPRKIWLTLITSEDDNWQLFNQGTHSSAYCCRNRNLGASSLDLCQLSDGNVPMLTTSSCYVCQMYVTENVGPHMALTSDNQNEPKRLSHDRRM